MSVADDFKTVQENVCVCVHGCACVWVGLCEYGCVWVQKYKSECAGVKALRLMCEREKETERRRLMVDKRTFKVSHYLLL